MINLIRWSSYHNQAIQRNIFSVFGVSFLLQNHFKTTNIMIIIKAAYENNHQPQQFNNNVISVDLSDFVFVSGIVLFEKLGSWSWSLE